MAAVVLGDLDRITPVPADPRDEADTLATQICSATCREIAAHGTLIDDSGVIIEIELAVAPAAGRPARAYQGADAARLADGITEAATWWSTKAASATPARIETLRPPSACARFCATGGLRGGAARSGQD